MKVFDYVVVDRQAEKPKLMHDAPKLILAVDKGNALWSILEKEFGIKRKDKNLVMEKIDIKIREIT